MAARREYDIEDNRERFEFDVRSFLLGGEITGIEVTKAGVVLALNSDRFVAFTVEGPNLAITISVPRDTEIQEGIIQ